MKVKDIMKKKLFSVEDPGGGTLVLSFCYENLAFPILDFTLLFSTYTHTHTHKYTHAHSEKHTKMLFDVCTWAHIIKCAIHIATLYPPK